MYFAHQTRGTKKKKYWPKGQREKNDPPPVASFKMKEVRQGINKGKTIRKSLIVYLRSWFLKNKPCLNAINGRYVQSIVTIQTFSFFFELSFCCFYIFITLFNYKACNQFAALFFSFCSVSIPKINLQVSYYFKS